MDSNHVDLDGLASWPPANSRPEPSARSAGRLPMPQLVINSVTADRFEYSLTTTCCHGQLGDRTPVRLLNWHPDQPVALVVKDSAVVGFDDPRGAYRIGPRGHLRLPAAIRHQCGIAPGQKLLVAVSTERRIVIAYPTAALDQALSPLHASARSAAR